MTRIASGLLASALALTAWIALPTSPAHAQVVVQGEGTVYSGGGSASGSGTVYVQEGSGSPYVGGGGGAATPQPSRVVVNTSPTYALLVPGIIAFGVGWLIHGFGVLSIAQDCFSFSCPQPLDDWVGFGWIPVVGPWLSAFAADSRDYLFFNVLMGIVQDVGVILAILGLVIQQEWEEPIYALGDSPDAPTLSFQVGAGSLGATLAF